MAEQIKYQCILINTDDYSISHLATFNDYDSAISYLNNYIEKEIKLDDYKKCFHDDKFTCSIYDYFYLFPKKLVSRLHIMQYMESVRI